MSNILAFTHPIIKDFQNAAVALWGVPEPRVVRRSNKSYVICGVNGESSPYTLDQIKLFTRALLATTRSEKRA